MPLRVPYRSRSNEKLTLSLHESVIFLLHVTISWRCCESWSPQVHQIDLTRHVQSKLPYFVPTQLRHRCLSTIPVLVTHIRVMHITNNIPLINFRLGQHTEPNNNNHYNSYKNPDTWQQNSRNSLSQSQTRHHPLIQIQNSNSGIHHDSPVSKRRREERSRFRVGSVCASKFYECFFGSGFCEFINVPSVNKIKRGVPLGRFFLWTDVHFSNPWGKFL